MCKFKLLVASSFLAAYIILGVASSAISGDLDTSGTQIVGEVVSVTGSRLTILLSDGSVQSVTSQQPISEDLVGKIVTGQVVSAGDTSLIQNPEFSELVESR